MSLRERIARILCREMLGAESLWRDKLRVVDLVLDEMMVPTPGICRAIVEADALAPSGDIWRSCITAAKSDA